MHTNQYGETFDLTQWTTEALNVLALDARRAPSDRDMTRAEIDRRR